VPIFNPENTAFPVVVKNTLLSGRPFNFDDVALELFRFQAKFCGLYAHFLEILKVNPNKVYSTYQIPFLPIDLFKWHKIVTLYHGRPSKEAIYTSSGTTLQIRSSHYVSDEDFYLKHAAKLFSLSYGPLTDYAIFALLPSYLERKGSSLVAMAHYFMQQSGYTGSGFFLDNYPALQQAIMVARNLGKKILLLGVTFALLDFAEALPQDLSDVIIMETGGMKGRKKEMPRDEVHAILKEAFKVDTVHSEYGMTELLSQAYSTGNGWFNEPESMRILLRDPLDPRSMDSNLKKGAINIIDLANADSCSFLQTADLGERNNNQFSIIGRQDNADLRGCNLLIT
jgi:hypothetical protein